MHGDPTRPPGRRTGLATAAGTALLAFLLLACGPAPDAALREHVTTPQPAAGARFRDPGYTLGSPDAPLTVIELSDFGCPYCRVFALNTFPTLQREYIETGRVRWRYVPFVMGRFPNGDVAAIAAECAAEHDEEAFWRMRTRLYEAQAEWSRSREPDAVLTRLAAGIGLDAATFAGCLAADAPRARVDRSNRMASMGGVAGTPAFFVAGRRVYGAQPPEQFRALLDAALRGPGM